MRIWVGSFKFRIYPNAAQVRALEGQLAEACRLYNACIQERRDAWRIQRKRVSFFDQRKQLAEIRAAGDIGIQNREVAADVVYRAERAFAGFFRRVRVGEKPGYPRFRSVSRYDTLGTRNYGNGIGLSASGLRVSGVPGLIATVQHRVIEGVPKAADITRRGSRWHVVVRAEIQASPFPVVEDVTGIDVGLASFAAFSNGETVPAPQHYRNAGRQLRRAQRHLARCQRGSRRRLKAKARVVRLHQRVADRRSDFTHKLSREVVNGHGFIAVEKLNIRGLVRTRLAKSIHDAGWRLFLNQLAYKAANAGREFVEVDASGTSQTCVCGSSVPKTLKDRWHTCTSCGLDGPRDVISAQVIEARGRRVQALTNPLGSVVCGGSQ